MADTTSSAEHAESWQSLIQVTADCLTCGEVAVQSSTDESDRAKSRRWARRHAEQNPGHHTAVETSRARSYLRTPPASTPEEGQR